MEFAHEVRKRIYRYKKKRPVWAAVLGKSLKYLSMTGAGMAVVAEDKVLSLIFLGAGAVADGFLEFFIQSVNDSERGEVSGT